jgi:hypothetical protein
MKALLDSKMESSEYTIKREISRSNNTSPKLKKVKSFDALAYLKRVTSASPIGAS